MNNWTKLVTGIVLSLVTCMQTWADEDTFTVDGIVYRIIGAGQVEVASVEPYNEPITIPATVNNYQVVAIAGTNPYITSVTISEGIERIGRYAFNGSSIPSITLPNSLKTIEQSAFNGCKFTSITIPENVETIGPSAFADCKKLQDVYMGSSVTSIGEGAFYQAGCESEELRIHWGNRGNTPLTWGGNLFYGCTSLKNITIPSGVTEIQNRTFGKCPALTEVTIPATVEKVWCLAFVGGGIRDEDVYVKRFIINDSTEPIYCIDRGSFGMVPSSDGDNYAYMGRDIIQKSHWDESELFEHDFSNVEELVIGPEVTRIRNRTFSFNSINSITFSEGSKLTSIGEYAFEGQRHLERIILPDGVTSIGSHAFNACESLEEIHIPTSASFTTIPDAMLSNTAIESLVIPANVTTIEENALTSTTHLASLTIAASDNTLSFKSWYQFASSPITTLNIGRNMTSVNNSYETIFPNVEQATIGDKVTNIPTWWFKGAQHLISVDGCKNVETIAEGAFKQSSINSFILPPKVTTIEQEVFFKCTSLTSLTLHHNLTEIKGRAITDCSALTSLTIPSSVTKIGYPEDINAPGQTFVGCTGLTELVIEDSNTPLDLIESFEHYFRDMPLETLYLGRDIECNDDRNSYFNHVEKIHLGSGVQNNVRQYFYNATGVTDVYAPWATPIVIADNSFTSTTYENAVLHVPSGKNSLYAIATGWKNFVNITSPESVTLNITATGNGQITVQDTEVANDNTEEDVEKGNDVVISIVPETNYELKSLVINGVDVTSDIVNNEYTIANIQANTTIVATFVIKTEHITISSAAQGTYCSEYDLDFSGVPGIKAYIASGYIQKSGTIILTRVTDVPAGTGLFVKGAAATYDIPYSTSTAYYANMLKGYNEATTIYSTEGDFTNYYLSNGTGGLGFYQVNSSLNLGAHSAILQIPTSLLAQARKINFVFDDEATGIESLKNDSENNLYFDLQGRRVNRPTKGIYIVNGNKMIIH